MTPVTKNALVGVTPSVITPNLVLNTTRRLIDLMGLLLKGLH